MFKATVNEFPFVEGLTKREKGSVGEALSLLQRYGELSKQHGTLYPLFLVPRMLKISKQRVHQLVQAGRLATYNFDGFHFVAEDVLLEFARTERKNGVNLTEKKSS